MTSDSKTRLFGLLGAAAFTAVAMAALLPTKWVPRTGLGWQVEHFSIYFVTTLVLCIAFRSPYVVAISVIVSSAILEVLQVLTPDRVPDLTTALCGAAGAISATILIEFFIRARGRRAPPTDGFGRDATVAPRPRRAMADPPPISDLSDLSGAQVVDHMALRGKHSVPNGAAASFFFWHAKRAEVVQLYQLVIARNLLYARRLLCMIACPPATSSPGRAGQFRVRSFPLQVAGRDIVLLRTRSNE